MDCSNQEPSEDPLMDMNVKMKEELPSNYTSSEKISEIFLKSEIKEEPIDDNSSIPTECTDNLNETLSDDGVFTTNVNLREKIPSNNISAEKISEGIVIPTRIFLKSEIKEEPVDDNSSIPMKCTDNLVDTLSEFDDDIELKNSGINEEPGYFKHLPCADLKEYFAQPEIGVQNTPENHEEHKNSNKMTDKLLDTRERPYQCDVCNKSFGRLAHLKQHHRVHTGEKPHRCDVCNKGFGDSFYLKIHQRVHTGEKPFQCDVCDKRFTEFGSLKRHQRIHTGEKNYQCDVCNKRFSDSSQLKKHQRVHTDEKPFRCDVCNKCFKFSSYLALHQNIHTGERPYQCDVCNKHFVQLAHLKLHQRVHTGEKPYRCDVCNKCFSDSSQLKRHQRVHTGEKPYKCAVCNKSFRQSSTLKSHKILHMDLKSYV